MKSEDGKRVWYLPLLISGLLLGVALAGGFGDAHPLSFRREALEAGQWWRLLSGQWVHLGWSHLGLNLLSLWLCWLLFGHLLSWRQWLGVLTVAHLAVGLGLYLLQPQLQWYVGFSGALHAPYIVGALAGLRVHRVESALLLAVLVVKLGWESLVGPTPGTAEMAGGPVVVAAHLYGAVGGVVAALGLRPWRSGFSPSPRSV